MIQSVPVEDIFRSMGLEVRQLPTIPGFAHSTWVLVEASVRTGLDSQTRPIPLLAVTSIDNEIAAKRELLADALELRANLTHANRNAAMGVGMSKEAAVKHAEQRAMELLLSKRLTNASFVAETSTASTAVREQLPNLAGTLEVTVASNPSNHPFAVAELRFEQAPYYLCGLGYGEDAQERAKSAVFAKFDTYHLPKHQPALWEVEARREGVCNQSTAERPKWSLGEEKLTSTEPHEDEFFCYAVSALVTDDGDKDPGALERARAYEMGLAAPIDFSMSHSDEDVFTSWTFHENSKLRTTFKNLPKFDPAVSSHQVRRALGKAVRDYRYTSLEMKLSRSHVVQELPVSEALRKRRSWGAMSDQPVRLEELSYVLLTAYGITGAGYLGVSTERMPLRATPSGGGLYPIDIFALVENVRDVEPGLYCFNPLRRSLQLVNASAGLPDLARETGYRARVESASVVLLLGASLSRNQWKYWERGYRTALLDCGHLAQSLVIAAHSIGLIAHPVGGFIDDAVNKLADLDGQEDSILHLLLLSQRGTND